MNVVFAPVKAKNFTQVPPEGYILPLESSAYYGISTLQSLILATRFPSLTSIPFSSFIKKYDFPSKNKYFC